MNQLTIRSQSNKLDARLREVATERGWSLNQAANHLLLKGAGLSDEPQPSGIGHALEEFIGSWSEDDARSFDRRIADATGRIDEDLWQ